MNYYKGQLRNAVFNTEKKKTTRKIDGKSKHITYIKCYDIFTFDIEVTSAWLDESGHVLGYTPGKENEYWNSLTPLALCYIWQFSFNETVYYGRTLEEFKQLLSDLPEMKMVIFIHNLAYEFSQLQNILTWDKVFAQTPHKPMKASCKEFPEIEFRCSYFLSNMSLEKWGKELGLPKMVGDLDYLKVRTPLTPLNETELKYCERDCEVVYTGIKNELKTYGNVFDIPLTSTGKVRQVVKEKLMNVNGYREYIKRLVPDINIYSLLIDLFAGGYTHCDRYYANRLICASDHKDNVIEHYDFCSHYPTMMIAKKFPCQPFTWIYLTRMPYDYKFDDYAYIFTIKFNNIHSNSLNTYIQRSKCKCKGSVNDNGRIVSADELTITCNELDWLIIKDNYDWDSIEILDSYYSKKDYLPTTFIKYILQLYSNKTVYKNVEGKEDIYAQSKSFLNSMYGMCVTSIVQSDCEFINGEWIIQPLTENEVKSKLYDLANKQKVHDKRYFLNYAWGCWVTAYARKALWDCMSMCGNKGKNVLYCDTDSIFCLGHFDFSEYNNNITEELKKACEYHKIDFALTHPKDSKGIEHPLGLFEQESNILEFKCLHAKCYIEKRLDNKLYMTVAGINKSAVELLDNDINNFKPGFIFDKDADCVKKNISYYLTEQPEVVFPDGYVSKYRYGINMRKVGYQLNITTEYEKLLEWCAMEPEDIFTDISINKLKGVWI